MNAPAAASSRRTISAAATRRPPRVVGSRTIGVRLAGARCAGADSTSASVAMVRESSGGSGKSGPGSNAASRLRRRDSSAIGLGLRGGHGGAQALERPVDPRLHAGHREVERERDVAERHVEVEVQKDRDALVERQYLQRLAQVLALQPRRRCIERRGRGDLGQADHLPPRSPAHLAALVGDDADEPRLEPGPGAQVADPAPGPERRLLKRVFRQGGVAQHGKPKAGRWADRRSEKALERVLVTGFGARDEGSLIVAQHYLHTAPHLFYGPTTIKGVTRRARCHNQGRSTWAIPRRGTCAAWSGRACTRSSRRCPATPECRASPRSP